MMPWKKLRAQPKPVKVAVIAPLSGPWARQGTLVKWGAETAINEINATGGIKSMGGAKLELVQIDAGDSAEKAKNAAQRLVAQEPEVVGGTGAWLSTFTLAVTEVTERAQIPWLTLSYADSITDRGFKYVFQSSMPAGLQPDGRAADHHRARQGGNRQGAGDRRHHRRQHGLAGRVPQADARRRAGEARHQAADGRDLHAAALRRDAADAEGALDAAGVPALRHDRRSPTSSSAWRS